MCRVAHYDRLRKHTSEKKVGGGGGGGGKYDGVIAPLFSPPLGVIFVVVSIVLDV